MKTSWRLLLTGILLAFTAISVSRADVLEMQNGDRYSGKVLAVSADTVVLSSEILGKINVPRSKVATLTFGANGVAKKVANAPAPVLPTNSIVVTGQSALPDDNADLAAMLRQLGSNTNFIGQVRQQMLTGSPEAAGKFDEMVNGLMSGQINMADLRKQAQTSAAQLRQLKQELGPQADDELDSYLKILDAFINETPDQGK